MDIVDFWRYFGALLLVLGLVGLAAVAARKYGMGTLVQPKKRRRLRVVESLQLSPKQRLVLIRRDNVEHLLVIGPSSAEAVETRIPVFPDPASTAEDEK